MMLLLTVAKNKGGLQANELAEHLKLPSKKVKAGICWRKLLFWKKTQTVMISF